MYQDKQPTCVTVIGWVWIIIGAFTSLSATKALFSSVMIGKIVKDKPDTQFIVYALLLYAIIKIGVAVLAIVSGINFLKLKSWARNVLEGMTWLFLILIVVYMVFWAFNWVSMSSVYVQRGFNIMVVIIGMIITGISGVPLAIMLKYLRGDTIKNAIASAAKPNIDLVSSEVMPTD